MSASGIAPSLLPAGMALAGTATMADKKPDGASPVKFFGDGEMFEPEAYLAELQKFIKGKGNIRDRYGSGGVIEELEKKFCEITGKESAIFLPTGTMANQLSIAILCGQKVKVYVQDTSHVYRDEADAAQSVFGKRLIPLAPGQAHFTEQQLREAIESLPEAEVFSSGLGAVSIENPVRRSDGRTFPFEEIKRISAYCHSKQIGLHLDGARIFMASAWTGIPVREYASLFDTVYISMYKYLGASAGAILCGPADLIRQVPHLLKVHGGSMYGNWTNAAMALYRLEGMESRLRDAIDRSKIIFAELNRMQGFSVQTLEGGTNIYSMRIPEKTDVGRFREKLRNVHGIIVPPTNPKREILLTVNETLLYRTADEIIAAFRSSS
jgi:threonine aldolase